MQLLKLFEKVNYETIKGNADIEISDIVIDSRKIKAGDVFVCIAGANSDGHDYIEDVIEKGAAAVVVEKEIDIAAENTVIIKTEDTKEAFSYMSAAFFNYPSNKIRTIGLTGTKGKTSSCFMIKNMLEKSGHKVGVIGTMGCFIGDYHEHLINTTPDSYTIQKFFRKMVDAGCDVAVMEVSSQALMLKRTAGIMFDYGIFTNLSPDHIGENEHKDYAEYIFWKSELFKQCRHGIFNIDDAEFGSMTKNATCDIHTFGMSENADIRCENIEYIVESGFIGIEMDVTGEVNDTFKVSSPGLFSAYNALTSISVAHLLGVNSEQIKSALSDFHVRGRVETVKVSDRFTLLIDYAHNAMSLESLLKTIKEYKPKRIVSLFGCGGNRSKLRRYEMGEISGKYADFSVLTADNSRFEDVNDIIADIEIGMKKTDGDYIIIPDRKEAMKYSILNAQDGDIVIFAGKGHEDYQEIKGERYPFDERDIIADILEEIKKEGFN